MFQLIEDEHDSLRSYIAISNGPGTPGPERGQHVFQVTKEKFDVFLLQTARAKSRPKLFKVTDCDLKPGRRKRLPRIAASRKLSFVDEPRRGERE
jgi:hypothetical protein